MTVPGRDTNARIRCIIAEERASISSRAKMSVPTGHVQAVRSR